LQADARDDAQPRTTSFAPASTQVPSPETAELVARAVETLAERGATDLVAEARVKGYEGEACGECGNFTLVRNGTCLKCDTCGATSGCS
jgi:ribonucleoside-diphosphate reductase alpha chain